MVVKPHDFISKGRGYADPAVIGRGPEYLRILYGPEYLLPKNLELLRSRDLGANRSFVSREFALGIESLDDPGQLVALLLQEVELLLEFDDSPLVGEMGLIISGSDKAAGYQHHENHDLPDGFKHWIASAEIAPAAGFIIGRKTEAITS